ncbi:CUB and zona pellucida-like domain-containing protein 1 [Strongylocentrotus purpuratus]|uniref:Zona pellucida sperm-binding protein 3 n=1 Tax=Strongylocentrotus purpuratus TaxID=7668 RepID=A0A7M7SXF8_STRPU|nr:CUB and zona pellucida-like domain-containing protein 1 [Strongylocentrotus purpuratus]
MLYYFVSLQEENTTITFTNVITYAKPGSEDGTEITREYHMQVRVECCLEKEAIISGSFRPQLGEVSFSDKGSGEFSLRLERFQTGAFGDLEVDTASAVLQEDDLFFAVGLESVQDVGMFIDRCWATTKQDSDTDPQHSLISSGCPEDDTVAINRSLGLHREGFSFEAFAFVGDYTEVYIHCSVKVCGAAKAQSFRDAGCPSESPPPDRKRRSWSVMSTQTISNGPIHIRRSTSDMATNDLSAYNPFAMLLIGMIATLVVVGIMIGVVKLVRNSTVINYQRLVPIGSMQEIE